MSTFDHDSSALKYQIESERLTYILFATLQAKIFIDGNQWCALYGDNLQDGVAGFGNSPHDAVVAFNNAWSANLEHRNEH